MASTVSGETHHISFIRQRPVDAGGRLGYFIDLPQGTLVTVNGITYENPANTPLTTPFYIGPLEGYALIELLSQPVFFFRDQASLKYTTTARIASDDEVARRAQYGEVAIEDTEVRWREIEPVAPGPGLVSPVLPPRRSPGTTRGSGTPKRPATPKSRAVTKSPVVTKSPGRPSSSFKPRSSVKPATPAKPAAPVTSRSPITPGTPSERLLIEDPCAFLRAHLPMEQQQLWTETLLSRVIATLNFPEGHQEFSFHSTNDDGEDHIYNPGRTLIADLNQGGSHVLLTAQIDANNNISLSIMNPMAWTATRKVRKETVEAAHQLLIAGEWWRNVFDSAEDMERALPEAATWTPCAQTTSPEASLIYTILNGLALLLDLEPVPGFTTTKKSPETFFIRTQYLFDLVRGNALKWDMVYAFLRCTGFARRPARQRGQEHDSRTDLPAYIRRFDQNSLNGTSFDNLKITQAGVDAQIQADYEKGTRTVGLPSVPLMLAEGVRHNEGFAWDSLNDAEQAEVVHLVREGRWNLRDTVDQLRERMRRRSRSRSRVSTPLPERSSVHPEIPESGQIGDTDEIMETDQDIDLTGEEWNEFDRLVRVPKVRKHGQMDRNLSAEDVRARYYQLLDEEFKPCEHLQLTLEQLLASETIREPLEKFRKGNNSEKVTTRIGKWLQDSEATVCVHTVLMAINEMQSKGEGFAMVPNWKVQEPYIPDGECIRPGRPFIVPFVMDSHAILFVMQIEEDGQPAIYILDSLPHKATRQDRTIRFNHAWSVICGTKWLPENFDQENPNKYKPKYATYAQSAVQPGSDECAYFSVLNAWGLALGLQLNPAAKLKWTDKFFQQLQDILHLARHGHADWRLIYAFLLCNDFVQEGVVPENRRFANTYEILSETRFSGMLYDLQKLEAVDRLENPEDHRTQHINRVSNLRVRGLRSNASFPHDRWYNKGDVTEEEVKRLQRLGRLDTTCTGTELRRRYEAADLHILDGFREIIPDAELSQHEATENVQKFRDYMERTYARFEIEKDLEQWVTDALKSYTWIMSSRTIRDHMFRMPYHVVEFKDDEFLRPETINLAIVAVVEAINLFQYTKHQEEHAGEPFPGGFAFSTSEHIISSRGATTTSSNGSDTIKIARPRRPWIMPVSMGSSMANHTILAVVQEENTDEELQNAYQLVILNSLPKRFSDYPFANDVKAIARHTGWCTHRTDPDDILSEPPFTDNPRVIEVPRQLAGTWHAGYNAIINGWLIAMGLHINPSFDYTPRIYAEARTLIHTALAGLLDWMTLSAWLIVNGLARLPTDHSGLKSYEKSTQREIFRSIEPHRRFGFTYPQTNELELDMRIQGAYAEQDGWLAHIPVSEMMYTWENGWEGHWGKIRIKTIAMQRAEREEAEREARGLERRVEEEDEVDGGGWRRQSKRKRKGESLELLEKRSGERRGGKKMKRSRVLGFLDGY
ncbi:Alpha-glucuronidase [Pyrenophora seminiperda CCB06]|uniref:Alpha-glucuronidase n=1 Tax=Pyrenophora seminiperda CCB06 TaxID=1302712 RepID=A0A3M7MD33_9PLEO|nr:Alpha-glucuronidase [Pyrenophora seminiperda CCB06]